MEGEGTALALVAVYVGGLDATMARSVAAYLESRQAGRFSVTGRDRAAILLVDVDQPGAGDEAAAAHDDQIVVGVGFGRAPGAVACRHYVQKPLTGNVLLDALSDVVPLVGTSSSPSLSRRTAVGRASHARDIFTTGRPYVSRTGEDSRARTTGSPTDRTPATRGGRPTVDRPAFGRSTTADRSDRGPATPARPVHITARMEDVADASGPATAAERLSDRLDVEPITARDGGDLHDPAVLATYRYDPQTHLDGLIRRVIQAGGDRPWELRGPMLSVAADPADGTLLVSGGNSTLRTLCAHPVGDGWSTIVHGQPPAATGRHRTTPESLLWNTTVWSSQGRLPVTMDPEVAVVARAWPDLTRCVLTPSVLAVVALLTAGPHRPADVSRLLAIPRSHAFVVLAALDATGLLEGAGTRPDAVVVAATPPPAHAERGLLRRFLSRLRDS